MWRERELWLVVVLVAAIYGSRIGEPTIRGEESRRARVAQEMMSSGDYIVPREQGQWFLSRPPLQNWLIAAAATLRGRMDPIAVRLPGVLATLLTCVLLYIYGRSFMTPLGAMASAAAYATMGQVLELGRLAETESLFTLLNAAPLLLWHLGQAHSWSRVWTWIACYALVALAVLTKGLQPPIYFGAAVAIYLGWHRRWRELIDWPHWTGLATLLIVVGLWQIPYSLATDLAATKAVYIHDIGMRFSDPSWSRFFTHLLTFPIEVLLCTAPWSLALMFYAAPSIRHVAPQARPCLLFMLICLAVAFPSCWLVAEARPRYFMPLYPCLAVLVGLAIEQCWRLEPSRWMYRLHVGFVHLIAVLILVAGVVVLAAGLVPGPWREWLVQPSWCWMAGYALAAVACFVLIELSMQRGWPMRGSLAALALAGILGLTYNSLVLNALEQRAEDIAGQVAELKRQLPPGERLVSLNLVHHLFAYHFHDDIEYRPWTGGNYDGEGYRYFCFFQSHDDAPHIPFDWQLVQVVSCDRHRHERPIDKMIVGRRVKEPFDALSEPACDPVSGDGRWAGAAKPALRERARLRQF